MWRVAASRPMAEGGGEPSNPLQPVRRRYGDAAALARIARAPGGPRGCALAGASRHFSSGKTEVVVVCNRRSARASASAAAADRFAIARRLPCALWARGEFRRGGCKKGEIAGVAANPLISLETAKENVWKSLEKAWKSLEFPWKILDFPWKGLEKFEFHRRCA
ncbi:MAG: hypothetical protein ABR863_05375 [Roseiarcus sp.]|jgi:hypothetical protein